MKILLVSDAYRVGGAEHYLLSLVSGLISQGHQAEIICPERAEWAGFCEQLQQTGAHIHRLPLQSRQDCGRFFFLAHRNTKQISLLKKRYLEIQPDILHINTAGVEDAQTCVLAAHEAGHTPVVTNHTGVFEPYSFKSIPIGMIDSLRKRRVLKTDAYVSTRIAVSHETVNQAVEAYDLDREKFQVVHNGLDIMASDTLVDRLALRQELNVREGDALIIAVAHLFKEKGLDYLLRAFSENSASGTKGVLVIAGDGPCRGELEALAQQLNSAGQVRFLGTRDDIDQLLRVSDLFVLPSLTEGFPLVVLKAMAASLPIIVTRVGGVPEMIQDGKDGCLVEPASDKALAKAINTVLADKNKAREMGDNARRRVNGEFSLSRMVEQTLNAYKN